MVAIDSRGRGYSTMASYFGASLKDLGKRWFAFSKMDFGAQSMHLGTAELE